MVGDRASIIGLNLERSGGMVSPLTEREDFHDSFEIGWD
jgi:hypothetical protein